jgi:hypothetical protein
MISWWLLAEGLAGTFGLHGNFDHQKGLPQGRFVTQLVFGGAEA